MLQNQKVTESGLNRTLPGQLQSPSLLHFSSQTKLEVLLYTCSLYAHPDSAGPSGSNYDRGERYKVGIKPSLPPGNTLNACFPLPSAWSRSSFQAYGSPVNLVQNRCMWGRKQRSFWFRVSYFSSQRAQSLWFPFVLFLSTIRVSCPSRWGKEAGPGICIQWLLSATSGPLRHLFRPRSSYSHILQELPQPCPLHLSHPTSQPASPQPHSHTLSLSPATLSTPLAAEG